MAHNTAVGTRVRSHRVLVALTLSAVATTLVAVVGAVLWFAVIPGVTANLATEVVAVDTTVTVADAAVIVPAGWAVQHPPFTPDVVRLVSPDGGLEIAISLEERMADAVVDARDPGLPRATEALSSGAQAVHVRPDAGSLLIAVGNQGAERALVLDARAVAGDVEPYTRTLAQLIDSVVLPTGAP